MKPPPPGPPRIDDLAHAIGEWANFCAGLGAGYRFDLDNWLNDVDLRQIVAEGLPMFGADELGPHGVALAEADRAFLLGTREHRVCLWGSRTARREKWTATRNWWYFRAPRRADDEFERELARVK